MANGFDHTTTADEVLAGLDLSGRRILVTGGNSGLGAETARALAAVGADVIITARDDAKGRSAAEAIGAAAGRDVEYETVELGSLASVRAFGARFLETFDRLDVLIANAGVMACPKGSTEDGFETHFGINHLGHFLLTTLLLPALEKSTAARVVNLSSSAHQRGAVHFDDLAYERTPYEKWDAYGQSKTANILFTVELDRRYRDRGVRAFAAHPGVIQTNLVRHLTEDELAAMFDRFSALPGAVKTVEQGAATSVYAAAHPELEGKGGLYFADCQTCEVDDEARGMRLVRSYAIDPANAERLWRVSEAMTAA